MSMTNDLFKTCVKCGDLKARGEFPVVSNHMFYKDGASPVCSSCIQDILIARDFAWEAVNKVCQLLDIPFVPKEFERLKKAHGMNVFPYYANRFQGQEFETLDWAAYDQRFKELKKAKLIERELPELSQERYKRLRTKWGGNYDAEQLEQLEILLNGIIATQSVTGALHIDQAKKICKISLQIDDAIAASEDTSRVIQSYEKMIKLAEFTPENVKDANDFSSFSEVAAWLERRGWLNKYYEGASKDIVDEVLDNIQKFTRKLYIEESSMGDQITDRIRALESAANNIHDPAKMSSEDPYDMTSLLSGLGDDTMNILGDDDD